MTLMNAFRSLAYNLFYVVWTIGLGVLYLPLLLIPGRMPIRFAQFWAGGLVWAARVLVGIRWRVEGLENTNLSRPMILVSNHQSAWETLFLPTLLGQPVFILKKELLAIPFVGWYMRKTGMVAVDRTAGAGALKLMVRDAGKALERGGQIIIFPEGTRVAVGESAPLHPGVMALYGAFGDRIPVVPAVVNSGVVWGRNSFFKRPGEVVVRLTPPMETGLDRRAFMQTLRDRIAAESRALPHA